MKINIRFFTNTDAPDYIFVGFSQYPHQDNQEVGCVISYEKDLFDSLSMKEIVEKCTKEINSWGGVK